MQKSVSKKSSKSCILTCAGRSKLKDALESLPNDYKHPSGSYNLSKIAKASKIDRATLGKILHSKGLQPVEKCKPVVRKSFEELFKFLSNPTDVQNIEIEYDNSYEIDLWLDENDFQEADKQAKSSRRKQPKISLNNEEFKGALGQLNYLEQKQLFQSTIAEVKPAATFLIHGKPDFGQRWLLNQLRYKIPYHLQAWQTSIHIKAHRRDITDIWRSLAQELGISTSPSPQYIVEQLYQHWQKSTVILAIHNVSFLANKNLITFMQEFWQPLVNKINNTPNPQRPQRPYRLLLFLLDYTNSKSKLEQASLCLLQNADRKQPHIPLELPELESFNQDVISDWVGVHNQLLSQLWKSPDTIENVMQNIVEGSHTPIFVLRQICECFEFNWEKDIAGKLAL